MAKCLNINRAFRSSKTFQKLTLVDVMCPVCRGIFIEPVTLPCRHGLCLKCFERAMDETSLTCPMCRKRVGGWLRTATKGGSIVNDQLWKYIKASFPEQVQKKLQGEDDGVEEEVVTASTPKLQLSSPGEIRREYELQMKRLEEEARRREEEERRASEELIRKLRDEEREAQHRLLNQAQADEEIARRFYEEEVARQRREEDSTRQLRDRELARRLEEEARLQLEKERAQQRRDEEMARLLEKDLQSSSKRDVANKENKTVVPLHPPSPRTPVPVTKGPMDSFVITSIKSPNLSVLQSSSKNAANCRTGSAVSDSGKVRSASNASCGSHDSINQEMHHFKPIKVVPRTPPKRLPDGQVMEPMLIRSTPRNLSKLLDLETPKYQPVVRLHHLRLQQQGKRESLPASSAFRGLLISAKEPARTMFSPASTETSSGEGSLPYGAFEIPGVTPPLLVTSSQLPADANSTSVESNSISPYEEIAFPPPAYDADLFYNPDMPLTMEYGAPKVRDEMPEARRSLVYTVHNFYEGERKEPEPEVEQMEGVEESGEEEEEEVSPPVAQNNNCESTAPDLEAVLRISEADLAALKLLIKDEKIARDLQRQFDLEMKRIDRGKGSNNPYQLRDATLRQTEESYASSPPKNSPRNQEGRVIRNKPLQNQRTIKEAFAKQRPRRSQIFKTESRRRRRRRPLSAERKMALSVALKKYWVDVKAGRRTRSRQ